MVTEAIGIAAAIWPEAWLDLFGRDPRDAGDRHRLPAHVGPPTGSSGSACRCISPRKARGGCYGRCWADLLRLLVAVGGGWAVLAATGSLAWAFATLGLALVVYGATVAGAVASGVWFRNRA